ncbi:hypothetical protein [Pseudonocardia sp. HH130629-09]|uniref:hypothetical protein n=1 Tax=Pseudonocardia sp. HH130629-09 TaxID=1641402 RepID=UPI000761282E|nr:hypothetical protein [Pseudonocardia sp. HH130629-09]
MLRRTIVVLALAGLLSACASDPGPAAAPSGSGGTFPVRIDHVYGSTEIPARPERVVTLG